MLNKVLSRARTAGLTVPKSQSSFLAQSARSKSASR